VPRDPKDFLTSGKVLKNEHGECVRRKGSRGIAFVPVAQDEGGERRIPLGKRVDDWS
jgi:hypothetical protein